MRYRSALSEYLIVLTLSCVPAFGQVSSNESNFVVIPKGSSLKQIVVSAANVVPSSRQLAWQEMEFTAFVHFTMNTFTDREWGLGTESEALFNPKSLDARQWAKVCREAGMKMIIMTAKHHDGFCLWPSRYTAHSVKNSPWRNGEGDVVKEISDACREFGLKFGVYLSPWDRHEKTYGDSPVYNQHFEDQLTELLSNYGTISEVWFDGANGEGPNGKRQIYDWKAYYRIIRKLQPDAVVAIMGPDVRWVGTESGYGRETEWSVVPNMVSILDTAYLTSKQDQLDAAFVPKDLMSSDLGSRIKLADANALVWYPAEVDVSIRPGWFYHESEDSQVKTPSKLLDIYYNSVGRNAVLLLNVPPDRNGLIHDNDVNSLMEMRRILNVTFRNNLAVGATVKATSQQADHEGSNLIDEKPETYWIASGDSSSATLEFNLPNERSFNVISLQEFIQKGQRVESFGVDAWSNGAWKEMVQGTTIGYKRLLRVPDVSTSRVRLRITQSRLNPALSGFGLYRKPPTVTIEPSGSAFSSTQEVRLSSDSKDAKIRYTTDGKDPDINSLAYTRPLTLNSSSVVKAVAYFDDRTIGLTSSADFRKARYAVTLKTAYNQNHTAGGPLGLADGLLGGISQSDPAWQGYEGNDLSAIVNLGRTRTINTISTGFLQDINSWIFFPEYVEYSNSVDGKSYGKAVKITTEVSLNKEGAIMRQFRIELPGIRARYLKIVAKNIGTCPPWHPGAGGKAWLFVDEIGIN